MIEVFNKKINPILDFTIPNDLAKEIKNLQNLIIKIEIYLNLTDMEDNTVI